MNVERWPMGTTNRWQRTTLVLAAMLLTGCGAYIERAERNDRAQVAKAMFEERCKKAGFFIHRTVKDVEGILVMKLRPKGVNYGGQFTMSDPYGRDLSGEGYLISFLRGNFQAQTSGILPPGSPPRLGFRFVEAINPLDGTRYRYTGGVREHIVKPTPPFTSVREPFVTSGYVMDSVLAPGEAPRYGVTYDDISTRQEREYWIAGSSLRVIDAHTGEVIAERVGYMWDPGQGNNSGGRSPWLHAASYACPSFFRYSGAGPNSTAFSHQAYQASDFVESVLTPKP